MFGLLLTVVIARTLGAEGQGIYSLVILLPTLLTTFLNLGIGTSAVYYSNVKTLSIDSIVKTNILFTLGLSCLALIGGFILIHGFSDIFFGGVPEQLLILILLATPVMLLNLVLQTIFQGKQDFKSFNIILLGGQFATLIITYIGLVFLSLGIKAAIVSYIAGQVFSLLFILYLLRKKHSVRFREGKFDKHYLRKALDFGLKSHLSNILAFLNYRSDILLLSYFLNPLAVGFYTVAVNIVERLWIISNSISTVLFPKIASLETEGKKNELTAFIARQSFFITIMMSLVIVWLADPLVIFLFGEEYRNSIQVLLWLLPGIISGSVSKIIANDFAGRGKPELNLYVSIVTVTINVLLNILFIPKYGLLATAFSSSATYTLNLMIKIILFKRMTGYAYGEFIFFQKSDFHFYRSVFQKAIRMANRS
ncbi:hypothetical protein WQ57_06935 [Mesobacillus campisalis]|uniref:Uncharacterized protein n=1 Tax=Mesobacillus campisalis TaxID=1408103 RepID=A0A0M2SX25_9BACI|nr:hypothetical protein WQ57_06935 [Mesobacillus campisalis]